MSAVEIFDCEQGSDDWYRVRMGMPTASEFATVLAVGKGGGDSKLRRTYLYKLAGERITDTPMESYSNKAMERGKMLEPEARAYYQMLSDNTVERIGFIKNGGCGCSPDGLVGNSGMLEVKTAAPHILIEVLENDKVPDEHYAQLQGNLWVAMREWIDLIVYYPGMPAFMKRVVRDDEYIVNLSTAVRKFNEELEALVARVKAR